MSRTKAALKAMATTNEVKKKVRVYDAGLNLVEREFSYTFVPEEAAANEEGPVSDMKYAEAISRAFERTNALLTGDAKNDVKVRARLLNAINGVLEFFASRTARQAALGEGALPKKAVNGILNAFRVMPQYAGISDRKAQTAAILATMRNNPALLATLAAANDGADDDGEDDGEE